MKDRIRESLPEVDRFLGRIDMEHDNTLVEISPLDWELLALDPFKEGLNAAGDI